MLNIISLHHLSLAFNGKRMRLVFLLGVLALVAASITTENEVERSQVCIRERISYILERGLCPSENGHFPTKTPAPANSYRLVSTPTTTTTTLSLVLTFTVQSRHVRSFEPTESHESESDIDSHNR